MPVMMMRESDPKLWEEGIERRGQCVWWYSASACFCISDGGRVDPNCPKCYGSGYRYRPVESTFRRVKGLSDGKKTIDIHTMNTRIKSVTRCILGRDREVEVASWTPTSFTPKVPITAKGVQFTLDYEEDLTRAYVGPATYTGKGIIEVPIIQVHNQGRFPGQISKINSISIVETDNLGVKTYYPITIESYWANKVLSSSAIEDDDVLEIDCVYEIAVKFLVTGINPKTKLQDNLILQGADAQCVFPGHFLLGRGDVIVLQMGEIKETVVGINDGPSYKFPYFKLARILAIEDKYGPITDYTLVRDNEILWGSRVPHRFGCSFTYHPTFSVLDDLPSVRYSEDKIWPRRVFLKKFPLFTYASKVLTRVNPGDEDTGLVDDPRKNLEQDGLI